MKIFALTFDLAFSSSFCLLQASSLQSGQTDDTNRMLLPSGDHVPPDASVEMLVTLRGSPVNSPAGAIEVLHPDLRSAVARRTRTSRACHRARSEYGLRPYRFRM